MPVSASRDVQHGLRTWIDYNRPWIFRRQFLVSEQTASILSNMVAMALTLAGPRLWILLKAFGFWAFARYERRSKRRSTQGEFFGHDLPDPPPVSDLSTSHHQNHPNATVTHNLVMSDNLATIENSHSELRAALDLITKVFKLLKADRIQLFIPAPMSKRRWQSLAKITRPWKNLIQQPFDVVVPFILSAAFIGLFVAQSSGSVLSARILTDKIALSIPPSCTYRWTISLEEAAAYAKHCYHAEEGAEGCNFFYNQSIGYIETVNETCPFRGMTCAWGRHSAVSFDTGFVDAHFLGINTPRKYQFRRKMLCAPLLPDGDFIVSRTATENLTSNEYLYYHPLRASPRFPAHIDYSPSQNDIVWTTRYNGAKGLWIGRRVMIHAGSDAIDPLYIPDESINSSYVTIFEIYTVGVEYGEIRDEPIFRALQPVDRQGTQLYTNNETSPGLLGCMENISFCDVDLKKCWNYEDSEPSNHTDKDESMLYDRPIRFDHADPNPDLARVLLNGSMRNSFTGRPFSYDLEAISHCRDGIHCHSGKESQLPRDQWKVEARQLFETSLATMQFNVLHIIRGNMNPEGLMFGNIPENHHGMCKIGKFKSTGWKNVSFWGLFGVLFLAAAIGLASVRNEKEELWLVLGAVLLYRASLWGKDKLKTILRGIHVPGA